MLYYKLRHVGSADISTVYSGSSKLVVTVGFIEPVVVARAAISVETHGESVRTMGIFLHD